MPKYLATAVICGIIALTPLSPPRAAADPETTPIGTGPAPSSDGAIPPNDPTVYTSSDGWILTVFSKDETLLPVEPLTSAITSREYLVGGTFIGNIDGLGRTTVNGGTFEVGYRIGCGILFDGLDLNGTLAITPTLKVPGFGADTNYPNVGGLVRVHLKPGTVAAIPVGKKSFKGTAVRVNIAGFRIKTDGCAGQSFIQSYSTLSNSTDHTEDVTTHLGTVKVF